MPGAGIRSGCYGASPMKTYNRAESQAFSLSRSPQCDNNDSSRQADYGCTHIDRLGILSTPLWFMQVLVPIKARNITFL